MSQTSTERRFLNSTIAAYLSQMVRLVVAFGSRMILARLVLPEGHGLYELALRVVTVASACRDLGIPFHLMRDQRRPYGTVFVTTLVLGILITALLIVGAPLFAVFDPQLPGVLRVFAVWVILDGLSVVPRTFFERELRIGRLALPEIGRGVVVAAVALGLAWNGWQVWSLVLGDLAGTALFAGWLWLRAWRRMPFEVRLAWLPDLVRKSVYLFLIWLVIQLVTHIDIYIIKWYGELATVGHYARAYFIAVLVSMVVSPRALLPALVEFKDDHERFIGSFRISTVLLLSLQVLAGYFLFFNADKAVAILLGQGWEPSIPLLRILCFVPFLYPFTTLGGELLKVRHKDRTWLLVMLMNLVSLVGFGVLFTSQWGATGMAWANYTLLGNLLMAWSIYRICGPAFAGLLRDLLLVFLLPVPLFLVAVWLTPADSWWRFAACMVAAGLGMAAYALVFYRPFKDFFSERRARKKGTREPGVEGAESDSGP